MAPTAGAMYGVQPGAAMYGPPPTAQQPSTYVVQGGFDAGARFDGISKPTIPVSSSGSLLTNVFMRCHSLGLCSSLKDDMGNSSNNNIHTSVVL